MSRQIDGWWRTYLVILAVLCTASTAGAQTAPAKESAVQQAQALYDQSAALFREGKYAAAIPLMEQSLAIRQKELGDHVDTAKCLASLASQYHAISAYAKAEPLYLQALQLRERLLGPQHPDTASSLNILANLYADLGALDKAEPLYKRALAIREQVFGPDHSRTGDSVMNLAIVYRERGQFAQAEPLYQRALAIREKTLGAEHPDTARALANLANLYVDTGAYAKAEVAYKRALAIAEKTLGPEHPDTAVFLNLLAAFYERTSDFEKAEAPLLRALAIYEKTVGLEHFDTALALNNLASLYAASGDYARAEATYQKTLAIKTKVLGPDHSSTAVTVYELAVMYRNRGEFDRAEPLLRQALAIRIKSLGAEHPATVATLEDVGTLTWARYGTQKAFPILRQVQVSQARLNADFLLSGSESRKRDYLQVLAEDTDKNISFSIAAPGPDAVKLGLTSVLQYKGRVLDALTDGVARIRQNLKAADAEVLDQLARVAGELSTLVYQGPGDLTSAEHGKRVTELKARQEKLETELSRRSADFRRQSTEVTFATVSGAIPANALLIEWYRYTPYSPKATRNTPNAASRYVAYLVKRGAAPIAVDVGDAQEIESLAQDFRMAVGTTQRRDFKESATALSAKLWNPLSIHLKGVERLLISPDGALNLLPMSALVDARGEFLAKQYEISYLTSGRDLLRIDNRVHATGQAIVMADPDFGNSQLTIAQDATATVSMRSADLDRGGLIFRPLAGTAMEARDLKKILNLESGIYLRADATETRLKQLHSPQILHIASHGFFLSDQELSGAINKKTGFAARVSANENPLLRSGIALAGANARRSGEREDGILTALEVAQLDLHGTELVVLSACDSGLGDIQNGEGIYGLRRALVLAGAQTQVTSLWKVSDEATRTLMVDFYQRLLKGEGRSEALRHAQLAMLATPELSHPYYWASFVPSGNWGPLPIAKSGGGLN